MYCNVMENDGDGIEEWQDGHDLYRRMDDRSDHTLMLSKGLFPSTRILFLRDTQITPQPSASIS